MDFTKEELSDWLKRHDRTREWLAEATGKSLGTIHNWFSNRTIPEDARATIALLMERDDVARSAPDETGLIQFTTGEFERIEAARLAVGNPPRPEFYRDAILQFVEDLEEEEEREAGRQSAESDLALLADALRPRPLPRRRPVRYGKKKGKKGRK